MGTDWRGGRGAGLHRRPDADAWMPSICYIHVRLLTTLHRVQLRRFLLLKELYLAIFCCAHMAKVHQCLIEFC